MKKKATIYVVVYFHCVSDPTLNVWGHCQQGVERVGGCKQAAYSIIPVAAGGWILIRGAVCGLYRKRNVMASGPAPSMGSLSKASAGPVQEARPQERPHSHDHDRRPVVAEGAGSGVLHSAVRNRFGMSGQIRSIQKNPR